MVWVTTKASFTSALILLVFCSLIGTKLEITVVLDQLHARQIDCNSVTASTYLPGKKMLHVALFISFFFPHKISKADVNLA